MLSHYVNVGVEELDQDKLTPLLRLRYQDSIADALADLGRAEETDASLQASRSTCIATNPGRDIQEYGAPAGCVEGPCRLVVG